MKYFFLSVSIILLIASCKKKEFPENVSEEPTFYLKATVNGNPLSFKAGVLDYYMYSSYNQDTNNLYSFIAEVKPSNCGTACNNSLKIEINDNQLSTPNGTSNVGNSVKVSDYDFANLSNSTPTLVGYAVQFKSIFNKTAVSHAWSFGDNSTSTSADPLHIYAYAGRYNPSVNIDDGTSTSNISNPIKVTISPFACQTSISVDNVNGNTVAFRNHTTGSGTYLYRWNFGDNTTSTDSNPTHSYATPGMYLATVSVTDVVNGNDSAKHNYYINTGQSYKSAPNFSISSTTPVYSNSLFSKVKITYTDNNGISYVSDIKPQVTGSSNFQIVSVEDYKVNEKNQSTKKIKITFNCKLFNGGDMIDLQNGEAVLAVSYK